MQSNDRNSAAQILPDRPLCGLPALHMDGGANDRSGGNSGNSLISIQHAAGHSDMGNASLVLFRGDPGLVGPIDELNKCLVDCDDAASTIHADDLRIRRDTRNMGRAIRGWRSALSLFHSGGSGPVSAGSTSTHIGDNRHGAKMESLIVSLIGVAISLATLVTTLVLSARKAGVDKVDRLEKKLEGVEVRLQECEEDRQDLREEILDLKRNK